MPKVQVNKLIFLTFPKSQNLSHPKDTPMKFMPTTAAKPYPIRYWDN